MYLRVISVSRDRRIAMMFYTEASITGPFVDD